MLILSVQFVFLVVPHLHAGITETSLKEWQFKKKEKITSRTFSLVRPRALWPSWQSGSKYKGIYKNTLILSCLKLKHSERFRAQQSLWTARWMSCGRGDPGFAVTPVALERVTHEPCSSDSNRSLEPQRQEKKNELSRIAFHPVTDSETVRLHFISTIALRCLIIILSLCLYFHCWRPLLCENCPLKVEPKKWHISWEDSSSVCVCSCECARECVRADPNKRFSQKVQSCRVCKSSSHDWGWPGRPGPIP